MKLTSKPKAGRFASKGQVSALSVRRLRGILKRKPEGKPFAEEWADHKRQEMQLEEPTSPHIKLVTGE